MTDILEPEATDPDAPTDYVSDVKFEDLALSEPMRRAIAERGYTKPTPVQAKAFQPVVDGKDLIVRSKTGTGKTAAFGIPLLEKLKVGEREVKALILCPTRELAIQVAEELTALAKYKDLRVSAIYGGASMKTQEDALEAGSAIIVGTPGRVYDHIRRKNMKLDTCTHAILDEADEMLNQGFYEEVTKILDCIPKNRQVLLFSATVPEDIQKLIARYTTNAETLLLSGDVFTVDHIHHIRYDVSDNYPKPRNLIYVLEMAEPENAIIFCNTRNDTELVTSVLNRNGFDADLLNGDLPQKERERVMGKIKRGEVAFMVATDIAARGIDISDLGHVINYSLPEDPAVYLHRVGRTGRMSKKGTAINLVSGKEMMTLSALEKKYNINFEKRVMPSPEEALKLWTDRHVREIKEGASGSVYEGYLSLAGQLRLRNDADDLIAFLLKYFFTHHRMEKAQAARGDKPAEVPFVAEPRPPRNRERERERPGRGERSGGRGASERSDRPRSRERDRERPAPAAASPQAPGVGSPGNDPPREPAAPRERKPRAEDPPLPPGQIRMWFNLGKAEGVSEATLPGALEGLGAPGGKLVKVEPRGNYSYLVVAEEDAPAFEALAGKKLGERSIKIERAKKR